MGFLDVLKHAAESLSTPDANNQLKWNLPVCNDKKSGVPFNQQEENRLLSECRRSASNAMSLHFALTHIADFYYKYRSVDKKYLDLCIRYCYEDIALLPAMQQQHVIDEKRMIKATCLDKRELKRELSEIKPFNGDIKSFERLAIIYDKEKEYEKAIGICRQAVGYYGNINDQTSVKKYEDRIVKLTEKKKMQASVKGIKDG